MESLKGQKKRKQIEISSSGSDDDDIISADENIKPQGKKLMKEENKVTKGGAGVAEEKEVEDKGSNNKMKRIIVWLRNDLRVHDNPVLDWAAKYGGKTKEVLPVYSLDPRFTTRKLDDYQT